MVDAVVEILLTNINTKSGNSNGRRSGRDGLAARAGCGAVGRGGF